MTRLLGISGSLRAGSLNTALLLALSVRLPAGAALARFALDAVPLYNQDLEEALPESVQALKAAIQQSDGLVVASPEYNYGMSGVLKNAIDWASRPAMYSVLKDKPVVLLSCSPSAVGGARAHAQMREAFSACLAWVLPRPQFIVADARNKISFGQVTDEATLGGLEAAGRDLVEYIRRA
jgi:chromate reductase, NAD(P)H dehydrogenase (quinone)